MLEVICENNPDIELVPTSQFEFGEYSFQYFNKLQSLFYPHYNQDKNTVITATTSAGKTICAELSIGHSLSKKKKVIFLCPLKALSQEKYDSWTDSSHFLSSHKIEILTGDHRLTQSKLNSIRSADIIIMTSEMLDTRTRFQNSQSSDWLKEVDLLVVDEAHLLATSRGPALEVGLMRFTKLFPSAKLLLLSATMSNGRQVAEWLSVLNNKKTLLLSTTWRPVELHNHPLVSANSQAQAIRLLKILLCSDKALPLFLTSPYELERKAAETRLLGGPENKKTLVFVHTKKEGKKLEDLLREEKIEAKFHNADLDKNARNKLEKEFKSDLDVLIATSTLAWGINLPARNVIIVGESRGGDRVDSVDIAQMAGRAGRFGMYDRGDVWLINCTLPSEFKINSSLEQNLAFHLVAEISSGIVKDRQTAESWYNRSFRYHSSVVEWTDQKPKLPSSSTTKSLDESLSKLTKNISYQLRNQLEEELSNTLDKLRGYKAIEIKLDNSFEVLPYGKIAKDLYLDPMDIYMLAENFSFIERNNLWENEVFLCWGLTENVKLFQFDYVPKPLKTFAANFQMKLLHSTKHRKSIQESAKLAAAIFHFKLAKDYFDQYQAKEIEIAIVNNFQLLIRDFGRIFSALQRISSLHGWGREKEIDVLRIRIINGVGKHLVELVKIPGIGGTIATQLYQAGLRDLDSILKNKDKLPDLIARKANVTRILNGLKELEGLEEAIDL